ncbi:unnamed protein product [Lactuca saligna]|uniref:Uncharacterized protein n=1 Tax=Lactuca saligna TaxID=75948 RepID=A0AA36EAI5_LACSI|nr:unnamed protein product [Lactuca saligna]
MMWNNLFTLLFRSFSKRVTGSDCASKLFMTMMYGIYSGSNLDYRIIPRLFYSFSHCHYLHSYYNCPCPPVSLGVSQVQTLLFTDSIATTTSKTVETPVTVNASDAGAGASGFLVGHSTPPISPFCQDGLDMNYGGDDDNFAGFTYSPLNIWNESDDEAPVTRR